MIAISKSEKRRQTKLLAKRRAELGVGGGGLAPAARFYVDIIFPCPMSPLLLLLRGGLVRASNSPTISRGILQAISAALAHAVLGISSPSQSIATTTKTVAADTIYS